MQIRTKEGIFKVTATETLKDGDKILDITYQSCVEKDNDSQSRTVTIRNFKQEDVLEVIREEEDGWVELHHNLAEENKKNLVEAINNIENLANNTPASEAGYKEIAEEITWIKLYLEAEGII